MTEPSARPPIAPEPSPATANPHETGPDAAPGPTLDGHAEPVEEPDLPEPTPEPMPEPVAAPTPQQVLPERAPAPGGTPVWLTILLVLVLGGGLAFVYLDRPAPQAADTARLDALDSSLAALTTRVGSVENGLRELARRPAPAVDTSALESRIAALEQRPAPAPQDVTGPVAAATAPLNDRIGELESKLQQDVSQNAARTAAAGRLRAASAALDAGKPLGDLPGAPPALTRFAQTPPPTEPALRLAFPAAASQAEAASKPSAEGLSFGERMWRRAQTLVTVRQGDKVIVGAPAAVTLNIARGRLDAGDLAGAVAALAPLDGPATAAMAPWRNDAQALLDARAALVSLGARS